MSLYTLSLPRRCDSLLFIVGHPASPNCHGPVVRLYVNYVTLRSAARAALFQICVGDVVILRHNCQTRIGSQEVVAAMRTITSGERTRAGGGVSHGRTTPLVCSCPYAEM